jgi:subtilisin family serine protease
VDHGADVVNLSYAGPADEGDREAVEYAISKDVVVVSGTGNVAGKHRNYPAAYPGVVSVGGLGRDGTLWQDSSWGSNTTLVAPAEENITANRRHESGYGITSGTSDATAYVSAAAALVREKHPDLTAGQVINRLIKTAKPLTDAKGNAPKLPDEKFGYGVVRPYRAVTNDIPAGPKAGPLAQSGSSDSSAGDAASDSGSSSSDDSSGWMFALGPPVVLFGLIFLVLVGVAVLVVVLVKRKDSRDRVSDPWASGGGPSVPPQQPGQQVQAPTGQFGGPPNSPPPPPNQPPSR